MKTICFDARFVGEAGPGRYSLEILNHLERIDNSNKYIVFLRKKGFELYNPKNPNFIKVLADYKWYSFEEQFLFLNKIIQNSPDLLYIPHFNIPILYPGRIITAIPDIIMHTFSTEKGTTLPIWYFKFKKIIYKLVVLIAVLRSYKVVVPTRATLDDFRKVFPFIKESKYVVAKEGVSADLLQKISSIDVVDKYKIRRPFLLFVSSMYLHKNIYNLVDAFGILVNKYHFIGDLVLVGKYDKFAQDIDIYVSKQTFADKIKILSKSGFIPDDEVNKLRQECLLYVFPSLKEGFSLTPMEAQAFGKPCAVSDIACHREIYEDSVIYFDPNDPEHIALKVDTLIKSPKLAQDLIDKGFVNLKKYKWEETAEITYQVFLEALNIKESA